MSGEWQDIESAPKDGRRVYVRRIYNGGLVSEGFAVWGVPIPEAPMLQPIGPDPLGRYVDAKAELEGIERAKTTHRWMRPDRIYAFPEPTEWREPTEDSSQNKP